MPKVLVDRYRFTIAPPWPGARPDSMTLYRGDDVSPAFEASLMGYDAELARAERLGAVGDDGALELATIAATPGSPARASAITDEAIDGMKVEELVAYAQQFPEAVPRILELEHARKTPRKGVLVLDPAFDAEGRAADPTRDPAGEQARAEEERARQAEADARAEAAAAAASLAPGH